MGNVEVRDSGNLQQKGALTHFLEAAEGAFKGVMVFGRAKEKKSFVFEEGKPFISSAYVKEGALGKVLFEKNLMNADQFKKVKEIELSGKTFFEALTEFNIIPKDTAYGVVLDQWLDDMSQVLSWESGQFASVEFLPKDVIRIETSRNMHHFLFQALIRKNKKVKSKFQPNMRFEIQRNTEIKISLDDLVLNDLEKRVYAGFNQLKPIKTVAGEVGANEAHVAAIILSLRELGFARADIDTRKKVQVIVEPLPLIPNEDFSKSDEKIFFEKLKKIDSIDFYEILDVKRDFNPADLQRTYFTLAKKYHPDRMKTKVSVPTKDAERFFGKITEAYNTLSNPVLRKEYEFKTSKEAGDHADLMRRIVESENIYLEGKALLNKNMFAEAIEKIQAAIALYDQEPEYYVKLGWALFRQGVKENRTTRIMEGKKMLVDAFKREYFLAEVSYYLGMISKNENKIAEAAKYFRKCISVESSHALATSELRMLEKKLDEKIGKKK